jgi:hypothetical protein
LYIQLRKEEAAAQKEERDQNVKRILGQLGVDYEPSEDEEVEEEYQ